MRPAREVSLSARWLVIPLSFLLFAQWPLRQITGGWASLANDTGQICFGLFVAVAITEASRQRAHLCGEIFSQRYSPRLRQALLRLAALFAALPWACLVLYAQWPALTSSITQLENFPETFNPGYFVLRLALALMALLVALHALCVAIVGAHE